MPMLNKGKEYYPLDFSLMIRDGKVYYSRAARTASWFYLDVRGFGTPEPQTEDAAPVPAGGS